MKARRIAILGISAITVLCTAGRCSRGPEPSLVPRPAIIDPDAGHFTLGPRVRIVTGSALRSSAEFLAAQLERAGLSASIEDPAGISHEGAIVFAAAKGGGESYELVLRPKGVEIGASEPAGAFYAVQTLLQLCPPEVYRSATNDSGPWTLPCVRIRDQPRFPWRGFLLDVARHFFTVDEVKAVADSLAVHKLNRFQLHLTDDQGWRLEIRKYPRLTEVGAWRKDIGFRLDPKASTAYGPDGRYGGFYTQDQARDLVRYAAQRHITLVPEIEMPGHAGAALSAYPELSCFGGPYNTDVNAGVFAAVFCPGKEETFTFLENVLREVMEVFPGKYIHIGGDEVPKDNWKKCPRCQERMRAEGLKTEEELQSYFLSRIGRFIAGQGRVMVGWSEMLQGGLPSNAILMDWIGGAVEAATNGHDVVASPTQYAYLDYYQSTNRLDEPRAIGGFVPLRRVFSFEPVPDALPVTFHSRVLGPQGNLWTEYIANLDHVEYMMYPRLSALAEVGWYPPRPRDYENFKLRMATHLKRLEAMGIRYRPGMDEPEKRPGTE